MTNEAENQASLDEEEKWCNWVKDKIDFYISSKKWDNVHIPQLRAWLGNFTSRDRKYACNLLNHFIYYSEDDLKQLCYFGITKVIFNKFLLDFDRNSAFSCSNEELKQVFQSRLRRTKFIPLSEGDPTESGHLIARLCTTTDIIDASFFIRPELIATDGHLANSERFIIIDDFLGSGDQLRDFWTQYDIPLSSGSTTTLSELSLGHPSISFEYLALVATEYGIEQMRHIAPNLTLHCCEQLTDEYRIYNDNSVFFRTPEEKNVCESRLADICRANGIRARGHRDLDYAIAFHHCAPV